MAWQGYIDNLKADGYVAKAAIVGYNGSPWAADSDFNVTPTEVSDIVAGFENSAALLANRVRVAGEKYYFLAKDDEVMHAKEGETGVTIFKGHQMLIIATYSEGTVPEQCSAAVVKLGTFLKGSGY